MPYEKMLTDMANTQKGLFSEHNYQLSSLKTLYIGGGTPSLWGKRGAHFLKSLFRDHGISLEAGGEFTLEVNPGTWTEEGIQAWKEFGINRFSLGVQALRKDYLKVLDRVHSVEDVYTTLDFFHKKNLSFSVDFMLGLPHSQEMKRDISEELDKILQYDPEHLSLYILTAKAGYKLKDHLPDDDFIADEYLLVANTLKDKGFSHYEVSNFAKPNKHSRHNLKYWKSSDMAALGPSATGFLAGPKLRFKWKTSGPHYVTEELTHHQYAMEKLYMGLRVTDGIEISKHLKNDPFPLLQAWEKSQLGAVNNGCFALTSCGFLQLDGLVDKLIPYIR